MIDFRKKLTKSTTDKKTNPIEIYESLDRRSIAGPLRPAQNKILGEWFESYLDQKDLIIKLHTGEGKTLIGLLILQSHLNAGKGPCLYVCPNIYLVEQAQKDAEKFGISYCTFDPDGSLPNDFIDGKKILIAHVQKVFNGKTVFGLGNSHTPIGSIILDDSHACIESIKDSFTININRKHAIYNQFIELFKDSLIEQGQGTFLEIENGDYNSFLPISYWSWIDKSEEVLKILSNFREDREIAFAWPFIKDSIKDCQAFISGHNIEIAPIHIPIEKFTFFEKANQRILMSATTQDDSFFIKGLGFDIESVKNPLSNPEQIWSGEKMLLIPSLIDEKLDQNAIISDLAIPKPKGFGIVALVSSFAKAENYHNYGALTPRSSEIPNTIDFLKKGNYEKAIVFSNRYDGIDLPDESCRILIIDGKPFFNSLSDRYEEANRLTSDSINIKIAQKVEQGLGRSVRGEKDYCIIFLIGSDLVQFIKSSRTNKYFSSQTKKQLEIGFEIAKMASEDLSDKSNPKTVMDSLIKQLLQRDEGWKEFYKEEMNSITPIQNNSSIYEILVLERKAAVANHSGDYEKACEFIQKIIDEYTYDDSERGWYLQILARYKYLDSKVDSNGLQKSAFQKNNGLLKPKEGINYKKLEYINESRIQRILQYMKDSKDYQELMVNVEAVLGHLEFGTESEKFEAALKELGLMLGFLSERPDKEIKKGPDNLWCGVGNQYFIFECKSEVKADREEINKHEAGQMNTHCAWFEGEYRDSPVKRIMIVPTKDLSYHGDFTHEVEIMRRGTLRNLRQNVKSFFKEFSKYELQSLTDETMQQFLNTHKLDIDSLKTLYSEKFYKKKS